MNIEYSANGDGDGIYEAMCKAPGLIYIESRMGLVSVPARKLWGHIWDNFVDSDARFRLDRITPCEMTAHLEEIDAHVWGRILRMVENPAQRATEGGTV